MPIRLSRHEIDVAIPRLRIGLEKYLWLQSQVTGSSAFHMDSDFQRRFNGFYRVRRSRQWRDAFYNVMDRANREQLTFRDVLNFLKLATGRYEASFASKLIATLHPFCPVIDSVVLANLDLTMPPVSASDRAERIAELYVELTHRFAEYLPTANGRYLVQQFDATYPSAAITPVKKLDLVLWQSRTHNSFKGRGAPRGADR